MDIAEANIIVTGAGSGIGRAIASALAAAGGHIVCAGRRLNRLEETVKQITDGGGAAFAVATDVTKREQVQNLVRRAKEAFGPIDVVFNNAGRFNCLGGVHELDPDDWWADVTVNLLGALQVSREVLPDMIARDRGVIINMNGGRPVGGSGYACGKAGLMELTRILTEELKMLDSRVIVLGAGPGLVRTEMTELQVTREAGRRWIPTVKEKLDAGDTRAPEEIANATVRVLKCVRPEHSGGMFNPDFDGFE